MFLNLKTFLESIDTYRDKLLFGFIKKYWPRYILPNHLTILRAILAFYIIYLLLAGFTNAFWITLIFVFGALLDLLDGSIARTLNMKTKLGAVIDPLADRLLILPIAIYSLAIRHFWLLAVLLAFEGLNALVGLWRQKKGIMGATIFGKTKMVLQCVAFAIIIFFDFPNTPSLFPLLLLYTSVILLVADIILKYSETKKNVKTL